MPVRRGAIADGQPEDELPADVRPRKEDLARRIDALQNGAVIVVRALIAKAYGRERDGRSELEARVGRDFAHEIAGQPDVLADDVGQSFTAVGAQDEPQLQRPKTAA